ncbi:sulfotransferase ssu-1-like isoform X2 [Parasteatoda tepidariorum]|uniref:sulfotransferase ssu-1-like isoform X2 n=1 Tax=Parasteatoda tepidariorum TaxID=114398 RepID=UPI00077FE02C|nr:sulfotransferase ssu-1-like [Parasteatoda tepidariorum]XP_042895373.1 sulfotransferase ssu-1-like [Parasteatoda tepidariorum]
MVKGEQINLKFPTMSSNPTPRYVTVEGLRFVEGFHPDTVRSALTYQPRPYDVFVVTYPKCGTTWMMQIALLLLHEGELPETTEEYFACTPYLEMLGAEVVEKMPRPSPIRSHLPFDMIPYAKHAKYIYVARHPKDCCISMYHHTKMFPSYGFSKGSFDDFFKIFIRGETDYNDYFDHLLSFYEHRYDDNIFFITYEQLRDDTRGAILQIADFLGEKYSKLLRENTKVLDKILHYSNYDFMKQDTFSVWKEALQITPQAFSATKLPPGLASWAESAVDSHYGQPKMPMINVRDLMRRSSLMEWDTKLKPSQEQKLQRRIIEKTNNSDVMDLWKDT